ncbi:hypothetical protein, partial [Streptomyces althioticus]|uniref:hypothetical protein n=1 Tax=Streptomyces althioticus TaxID=83380 RepID=UPI003EBDD295
MGGRARPGLDALAEVAASGALLFGDGLDVPTPPDRLPANDWFEYAMIPPCVPPSHETYVPLLRVRSGEGQQRLALGEHLL